MNNQSLHPRSVDDRPTRLRKDTAGEGAVRRVVRALPLHQRHRIRGDDRRAGRSVFPL